MDRVGYAYKLLGIAAGAPLPEVTRAYRLLAKKYHPDSNPDSGDTALTMMMRINEAYETVKDHIASGGNVREKPLHRQAAKRSPRAAASHRAQRPDAREQAREQYRKEREAVNLFWQQRLEEREREEEDFKSYRLLGKHLFAVISDFYEKRLHYTHVRERPFNQIAYEEFCGKYEVFMEKSEKLSRTALSKEYRNKFRLMYEFLLLFADHIEQHLPSGTERRASTLQQFGEALNDCDHFLSHFFESLQFDQGEMVEALKRVLGSFEGFIRAYPNSPLVDYADSTVDVLQRLYRAFLKE
jgi:curved DNA-binding protein CbpA